MFGEVNHRCIEHISQKKKLYPSGRVDDDFVRLIFLHEHRETSILAGELPEESE